MNQQKFELEAEVVMKPSFQDADPMGVVYHGNYFRFFEEARRVLMEKIRYGYHAMNDSGYMWPVIDTRVKYIRAIPFHHEIRVTAKLTEWENRLRVDYLIYDNDNGTRMTKAHTVQVAVERATEEMCFVSPKVFTDKVEYWFEHGKLAD
ncbi:4-hydroxybenzoyl-CoA thioesterase [Vibrio sp. HA2012]|uniref:acyl-CoA thioesterase n=1 Tax=Vibrio sp. HA2012 TaxID=1971595 RepID=UPI000C2BCDE6|nr:acyl-CoA thioesterase [Vibrio sp. HA2012]PJC85798.1 4-hydroxybenzoyl-CoA thioesterase [Vibrio sp. HA2012]